MGLIFDMRTIVRLFLVMPLARVLRSVVLVAAEYSESPETQH